ncbi:MAG: hypothetical protein RBS40_06435 [Rhodocyclaceae bacterium]|jgi:hypothetical protein|nr:hypothetical protein [Rhodocyclaceae bacterium]
MDLRIGKARLATATLVASAATAVQVPVHLVYAASKGFAFEGGGAFRPGNASP